MKKILKKYIPPFLKKILLNYINNKIIKNYFQTEYKKLALLSYIIIPFKKDSFSHTNYYEAQTWAKVLYELGYNVDIINYDNTRNIDLSKYDLICGFGDVFQRYFEGKDYKAKTIYYGTGMHVCHQNNASLSRLKDVYKKRGVWLGKSARFVEKTWTHQTTLVDGIIALGNEVCAYSYRKYYDGLVYSLPAPFYQTQNGEQIIKKRDISSMKQFLWFGSLGLIHKGLDLCLEYFSQNKDMVLHICGPIENEKDFSNVYKKELFATSNIQTYGFVDIKSKEFETILSKCSFVIFPSCSEGGCPSVLTAIGNGGLIPIITKETTIKTGYQIWIDSFDYEGIDKTIKQSQKLSFKEIKEKQYKNLNFVRKNHTQEIYYKKLKEYIRGILETRNEM